MSEEIKRGRGRPRKEENVTDAMGPHESSIIAEPNARVVDMSVVKYNEVFNYLGRQYVKKNTLKIRRDKDGKVVEKWGRTPAGMQFEHIEYDTGPPEFYSVTNIPKSSQEELAEFGRPLTVERRLSKAPIAPEKIFIQTDEPIVYECTDFQNVFLKVEGDTVVEHTRTPDLEL